METLGRVKKLL